MATRNVLTPTAQKMLVELNKSLATLSVEPMVVHEEAGTCRCLLNGGMWTPGFASEVELMVWLSGAQEVANRVAFSALRRLKEQKRTEGN